MNELDFRNIDRSTWKKYRFEEIADSISERVEPGETDLDIYVGLEHLDAESLHIKRTGVPSDVKGTKLKVYKGDVIFGKRRAYQRKAAIAHFDGICSAHAMVLRARSKVIDPKLLPFFLHSDCFMHRAIDISVGGLSPTINWGTLRTQEFLIPPEAQQAKLTELLWAADEVIEKYKELVLKLQNQIECVFDTVYNHGEFKLIRLKKCLEFSQYGISEHLDDEGEIPVLRMNNLQNKKVNLIDLKYINRKTLKNIDDLLLKKGDVLFNRTNSYELVGKVGLFDFDKEATFASYLIRLRVKTDLILPEYLNLFLNSSKGQVAIKTHRTPGVSQSNINPENLKSIKIPLVSISAQKQMMKQIFLLEDLATKYQGALINSVFIQKEIINQIFS